VAPGEVRVFVVVAYREVPLGLVVIFILLDVRHRGGEGNPILVGVPLFELMYLIVGSER